jgi:hypothetical protein
MPRKQHTHHYIYKITCNVTGKYYIGMHSTSNLDDGYFGSGKRLRYSLNKYGKENHTKEILEWLEDRSSLKKREEDLVNEKTLFDPMCMNLQIGGGGGFSENSINRMSEANSILRKNPEWIAKVSKIISTSHIKALNTGTRKHPRDYWLGKKHKPKTIEKMKSREFPTGSDNSQYGTCWIMNSTKSIKIKREELLNYLKLGWKQGRKFTKPRKSKSSKLCWITNSVESKMIKPEELKKYSELGWQKGRNIK